MLARMLLLGGYCAMHAPRARPPAALPARCCFLLSDPACHPAPQAST